MSDVQHQLIHTHPPDDPGPLAAHQHFSQVGKGPWVAVGVTDGYGGDLGFSTGGIGSSIADIHARAYGLYHRHYGFQLHQRSQVQGPAHLRGGLQAVQNDSGPYQVKVHLRIIQDSRAVAAMAKRDGNPPALQGVRHQPEALILPFGIVRPGLRLVRHSEMGKQALQQKPRQLRDPPGRSRGLQRLGLVLRA